MLIGFCGMHPIRLRNWLNIHCLSDGLRIRLPYTDDGHAELEGIVGGRAKLVCLETNLWADFLDWRNRRSAAA